MRAVGKSRPEPAEASKTQPSAWGGFGLTDCWQSVVRGTVVGGKKMGRELGFPTANIVVDEQVTAPDGVYKARAATDDGRAYRAIAFLKHPLLETHLFDFAGDLYGRVIEVELLDFIRPEQKFASPEELKTQISEDIRQLGN